MKKFNNKSGFTLIEIIVVLIIVGILAAIALPNLFNNVVRAQSGEAIAALGSIKSSVDGCVMGHPTSELIDCSATSSTFGTTANFTYSFGATTITNGTSGGNYTLKATNVTTAGDTITLTKSTANGSFACTGGSAYAGVC